ncbi:tetratricopeptide repeat protein [Methanofollis ethanolicus]|uniref:tetratricopeptide repeat protein n=1 Tax=Methanofollis ethanolicus TaxID=488124 RepID=UPI000830CD62|nr:tetratricopeptide repeat protein [Methanofollis ethanolicus]
MKIKWLLLILGILVVAGFSLSDRIADDPEYLSSGVADVGTMAASTLISFEQYEAAAACADFASTVVPDNPGLLRVKGKALSAQGKYDEAVVCYDMALTTGEGDATTLSEKGKALMKAGDLEGAIAACADALARDPADLPALQTAGASSLLLGQYDEAVGYYDRILQAQPENAAAWIKKGDALLYISLQEEEQMKEAFRDIGGASGGSSFSPNPNAYMDAIECFNHAIALDPKTAPLLATRLVARSELTVQTCEDIVKNLG